MDAETLRDALSGEEEGGEGATDDPVTAAGRKLAKHMELDDEGLDLLTGLVQAVVEAQ